MSLSLTRIFVIFNFKDKKWTNLLYSRFIFTRCRCSVNLKFYYILKTEAPHARNAGIYSLQIVSYVYINSWLDIRDQRLNEGFIKAPAAMFKGLSHLNIRLESPG